MAAAHIGGSTKSYGTISERVEVKPAAPKDTCITMAEDERKPLLSQESADGAGSAQEQGRKSNANDVPSPRALGVQAIFFLFMLTAGMGLAAYLLWSESSAPTLGFRLHLVPHEAWSAEALSDGSDGSDGFLNRTTIENVVITHTGTRSCAKPKVCENVLRALQQQQQQWHQQELPYNFLIGEDDRTYEVRGRTYDSGVNILSQASTLVIGLIGNYTLLPPTGGQMLSVLSLLHECAQHSQLSAGYHIYGLHNLSRSADDAEQLLQLIMQWPQYVTALIL